MPPERVMGKKLGVSRPPLREAYCVLEIVGILESKVGSGTFVRANDIDQISLSKIRDISNEEESPYEILEVRKIIEPEIVTLAAKNATEEDIQDIEKILEKMKEESLGNDVYTVGTDALFHLRIAQATGNALLFNVMNYIAKLMREMLWGKIIDGPDTKPEDLKKDMYFHEDILKCIKNKDIKNARSIMVKRFSEIQKKIE